VNPSWRDRKLVKKLLLLSVALFLGCSSYERAQQSLQSGDADQGLSILRELSLKKNGDALRLLLEYSAKPGNDYKFSKDQIALWKQIEEQQGNAKTLEDLWGQESFFGVGKQLLSQAKAGEFGAQIALAKFYFSGVEIFRNSQRGIFWLNKAAEQGNPEADLLLALVYYSGDAVAQDFSRAKQSFQRAARGGKFTAYIGLGRMALGGLGEPVNLKKAYAYFSLANRNTKGEVGAKEMQAVGEKLSAQEKMQALEMARQLSGAVQ